MKKSLLAFAATSALFATVGIAHAESSGDGPWMVRARAVYLQANNSDSSGLGLAINNKVIPEVDVTYFFTSHLATELILTVPQQQTVHSDALGSDLGTLKHLPPTLLFQYHMQADGFKPYVGVGVNFTQFSDVNFNVNGADVGRTSTGLALQLGVDVPITKNVSFNLDLKQLSMSTDVYLNGSRLGTYHIDPMLFGVGVGYRF